MSDTTAKRRRQTPTNCATRACDQCKLRKTKCSMSQPCEVCALMGFDCTFLNPQKKRGPPGHRVTQIRQQNNQSRKLPSVDNPIDLASSHQNSLSTNIAQNVSNFDSSQARSELTSDTVEIQMPTSHFEQQHQLSPVDNPHRQDYDNSLISNNTPTEATTWNGAPDLEHWLADSFNSHPDSPFGFPGSNIFVKQTLPPIIEDVNVNFADPVSYMTSHINTNNVQSENQINGPRGAVGALQSDFWPLYINEISLIPWIDVYFDRLHPTLPVLSRSPLFTRIFLQEHRCNPQFGAMILSLCAFSLTQPIDISERPTSSSRADQAKMMMNEATRMRSSSDFGENPTIEAVLTSFFLFGYLFGSNQRNAARLRLREAVDLASTLGLNDPRTYKDCSTEEKGQWLRTYLVLSVTERAYALQHRHPISFTGRPPHTKHPVDDIQNATQHLVSGIIVHNEKDAAGMMGLGLLMEIFDTIDEDILVCWHSRCNIATNGRCHILAESKVLNIFHNLARVSDVSRYNSKNDRFDLDPYPPHDYDENHQQRLDKQMSKEFNEIRILGNFLSETQCADILVTQKWVQDRLWNLCFNHGLLRLHSEHKELCFRYAFDNAEKTLELCRWLRISAMEAHGIGIIEKLYNIAASALMTPYNTGSAESDMGISDLSVRRLASQYLKLMQTLRGGNHPYMEQYKAHLKSLFLVEPNNELNI